MFNAIFVQVQEEKSYSPEMLAWKGVAFCISFTIVNAAFVGLERAVVLQTGKRAGAEAPLDVYMCTSLINTVSQGIVNYTRNCHFVHTHLLIQKNVHITLKSVSIDHDGAAQSLPNLSHVKHHRARR